VLGSLGLLFLIGGHGGSGHPVFLFSATDLRGIDGETASTGCGVGSAAAGFGLALVGGDEAVLVLAGLGNRPLLSFGYGFSHCKLLF
jgi:hypothetical protein